MSNTTYVFHEFKMHMIRDKQIRFLGNTRLIDPASGAKLVREVIRSIGQTDRENFVVVMLDTRLRPVGANLMSTGCLDKTVANPREVIKPAINLPCKAMILGHNHPSGDADPSDSDKAVTLAIMAAANMFGITVVDHIVVDMDSDTHMSFAETNIINEIKDKVGYVIKQLTRL